MLHLASRMARHRVAALLAVACAILGGPPSHRHRRAGRVGVPLARAGRPPRRRRRPRHRRPDVRAEAATWPSPLPERARVPADLTGRLAAAARGHRRDRGPEFPRRASTGTGPGRTGRGPAHRRPRLVLDRPAGPTRRSTGTAPAGPGEVALDRAPPPRRASAPGGRVTVIAAGRPRDVPGLGRARHGAERDLVPDTTADAPRRPDTAPRPGRAHRTRCPVPERRSRRGPRARARPRTDRVHRRGARRRESPDTMAGRSPCRCSPVRSPASPCWSSGSSWPARWPWPSAPSAGTSPCCARSARPRRRSAGSPPRQARHRHGRRAVPGIAAGYLLAGQFRRLLARLGVIPAELPLAFSPLPRWPPSCCRSPASSCPPARRSWRPSRMPATEAVAESRTEPRRPSRSGPWPGCPAGPRPAPCRPGRCWTRTDYGAAGTSLAGIVAAIGLALAGRPRSSPVSRPAGAAAAAPTSAPTWLAVANARGHALRTGAT